MSPPAKVLLVDDSAYSRSRLRRFLAGKGVGEVFEAGDGETAVELYKEVHPRLVLLDQVMRGPSGIETAQRLLACDPTARIVMLTVVAGGETRELALACGVLDVLGKADWDALTRVVDQELCD